MNYGLEGDKITVYLNNHGKTVSAYYKLGNVDGKDVLILEDAGGVVSLTNRIEEVVSALKKEYGLDNAVIFHKDDEEGIYFVVDVDLERSVNTRWRFPSDEENKLLQEMQAQTRISP